MDHFVSDCRKRVQLEDLRNDLELYYKLLKTAMVELINKDYADFVNLSTNLVSLTPSSAHHHTHMHTDSSKFRILETLELPYPPEVITSLISRTKFSDVHFCC